MKGDESFVSFVSLPDKLAHTPICQFETTRHGILATL